MTGERYEELDEEQRRALARAGEPTAPAYESVRTDFDEEIERIHARASELREAGVRDIVNTIAKEDAARLIADEKAYQAERAAQRDNKDDRRANTRPRRDDNEDSRPAQPLGKYDQLRDEGDRVASLGNEEMSDAKHERLSRLEAYKERFGGEAGRSRDAQPGRSNAGGGRGR